MHIKLVIANAFSINNTGGNPAGIVLDADNLTPAQKQSIATRAGLSETAFVSRSNVADVKLEFFTPNRQIAHCGHATIATFTYLRKIGLIKKDQSSKETIDGIRKIFYSDGEAYMEQSAPKIRPLEASDNPGPSIGLPDDRINAWAVNTGNTFILIEVENQETLARLKTDNKVISSISEKYSAIGYYVFTREGLPSTLHATTRMFAPLFNIVEEAGTGMAAGPLACLLFEQGIKEKIFYFEQGKFMTPSSTSLIKVQLETNDGKIDRLFAGGDAYISVDRSIEI